MGPTKPHSTPRQSLSRRGFIQTSTMGIVASALQTNMMMAQESDKPQKPIRWGFVGTGGIANAMAKAFKHAPNATLAASSSRSLEKAEDFAKKYQATKAFGSWAEMLKWDGIDAVYLAVPTFVKEEIAIAAAQAGKHVLCEKPLPSLPAVKRMLLACRENNVAFMDGTHFSHHPRSQALEAQLSDLVGKRRDVHSVFQFNVRNESNIRLSPTQEPMGAIGDAGWYNMRAIVDYLDPSVKLKSVYATLRREEKNNAVTGGSGIIVFDEGSTATFSCAIDAGANKCVTEINGKKGAVEVPVFVQHDKDNSASYIHIKRGGKRKAIKVDAPRPDAAIMFEDFAKQVHNPALRKKWEAKSELTQTLLDAVWKSALANEKATDQLPLK